MNFLYQVLFLIGLLVSAPYWIWRAWKKNELDLVPDRLGFSAWPIRRAEIQNPPLWIHAVSVGEVQAARPLLHAFRAARPDRSLALSVTTRTGMEIARKALANLPGVTGPLLFPLDLPWAVNRRLRELGPAAVIFIDTEIWPNLIRSAAKSKVRLFLANGRISDRSFLRYRSVRFFLKPLLEQFTCFWMQSDLNAERLIALGAPPARVRVSGNLKIDALAMDSVAFADESDDDANPANDPPVLLAASTHAGEEQIVLAAAKLWNDRGSRVRLAIAPRHPERADEVRGIIDSFGFRTVSRSELRRQKPDSAWPDPFGPSEVFLIDTVGELSLFFPRARAVFVGGSLVPTGGHNIFEPAAFGRPVFFGPHMENFREAEEALSNHGAIRVGSPDRFADAIEPVLFNPDRAESLGRQARTTVRALQGAASRVTADLLEAL